MLVVELCAFPTRFPLPRKRRALDAVHLQTEDRMFAVLARTSSEQGGSKRGFGVRAGLMNELNVV